MLGELDGRQAPLTSRELAAQSIHEIVEVVSERLRLAELFALVGFSRVAQHDHGTVLVELRFSFVSVHVHSGVEVVEWFGIRTRVS